MELGFSFYLYLGFIYCFRIVHMCMQTLTCECRGEQIPCKWSYWCCELSDTGAGNWGWVLNKASALLITSPLGPPSMTSNNTNILTICIHMLQRPTELACSMSPDSPSFQSSSIHLTFRFMRKWKLLPNSLSWEWLPKSILYIFSYYVVLLFVVQKNWRLLTLGLYWATSLDPSELSRM